MKLVYLIPDLASAGGTIRVLHNKVCWFVRQGGYEITIITTDQKGTPVYFDFPDEVRIIDLGINYSSVYNAPPLSRVRSMFRKRREHYNRLSELLMRIGPDLTITIYPSDAMIVRRINDGSKKIIEFHGNRYFRLNQGYTGFHRAVAIFKSFRDYKFVKRFDRLVVLTNEGADQWRSIKRVSVIPNAVSSFPNVTLGHNSKRVIAVGRLVYEKGFDRLIRAWGLLPRDILSEWKLDIYGDGPLLNELTELMTHLDITSSVNIHNPTKEIFKEYAGSSFLVMSSYTEGFPMVLIEAMSCACPVVSFDCACGPKDIITDGINGFLVENGNISSLSRKMEELIRNEKLRFTFSENAKQIKDKYSEEKVMGMWVELFKEMTSDIRN